MLLALFMFHLFFFVISWVKPKSRVQIHVLDCSRYMLGQFGWSRLSCLFDRFFILVTSLDSSDSQLSTLLPRSNAIGSIPGLGAFPRGLCCTTFTPRQSKMDSSTLILCSAIPLLFTFTFHVFPSSLSVATIHPVVVQLRRSPQYLTYDGSSKFFAPAGYKTV